jgi:hypothetical protein
MVAGPARFCATQLYASAVKKRRALGRVLFFYAALLQAIMRTTAARTDAGSDNKPPQLAQVVHAKMVALGWVRAATAAQARVPWWRDGALPPASIIAPSSSSSFSPSREPPRGPAVPCVACGGASLHAVHLAHVALPFWATCAEHTAAA